MARSKHRDWTREEHIVAFNLYCKTSFGRIHRRNPEIIELADLLGRTPSSVAMKLANFSRLDPALQARGIRGFSHGSKGEVEIWNEFAGNWDTLAFESEQLIAQRKGIPLEKLISVDDIELPEEGKERERVVRVRVNQYFFRAAILAAYDNRCCVTGISVPQLLSASHISPWSLDTRNRMNPSNGLCLNLVHHRAFDLGLITLTPDFRIRVSSTLLKLRGDDAIQTFIGQYHDAKIRLPNRFLPDMKFLKRHHRIFVP